MADDIKALLRSYLASLDACGDDVSAEEFSALFELGVTLHNLTDAEIAKAFSANRTTANPWRRGKSAPARGYRRIVIRDLKALTRKRVNELERRSLDSDAPGT